MRKPVFEGKYCGACRYIGYHGRGEFFGEPIRPWCRAYQESNASINLDGDFVLRHPDCITEFGLGDLIDGNEFAPGVCSPEKWHELKHRMQPDQKVIVGRSGVVSEDSWHDDGKIKNRPGLNDVLGRWAQENQPELLHVMISSWNEMVDGLIGMTPGEAAALLEQHFWKVDDNLKKQIELCVPPNQEWLGIKP